MKKISLWLGIIIVLITAGLLLNHFFINRLAVKKSSFSALPGWNQANTIKSFTALQKSCRDTLKQPPETEVGSQAFPSTAKQWFPLCRAALKIKNISNNQAKQFFEKWFDVFSVRNSNSDPGLFTAYYLIEINGSLTKSKKYSVPIYNNPKGLVFVNLAAFDQRLKKKYAPGLIKKFSIIPFPYSRKQINAGKIAQLSDVIAWTDSRVNRYFLQVQGSGYIHLPSGKKILLGYAGQNGMSGTLIGKVLIRDKYLSLEQASGQGLRQWLLQHTKIANKLLDENNSFVFFRRLPGNNVYGVKKDVPLTPNYSLAVDPKIIPIGAPVWLSTNLPSVTNPQKQTTSFKRLMIAQDVGGAIKGYVRGDIYMGGGKRASIIGSTMRNPGKYWVLLPVQGHHN